MNTPLPVPSFRRLRAFETIARTGSVSAAAQALRLSQPAVTHALNLLEAELGARLFERRQDGSFLNADGAIFRRRTGRFFDQIVAAVECTHGREDAENIAAKIGGAQVRSLLAIWQTGSFRAAAQALEISEPSLQRPARALERLLETTLYRRSATGLGVNETGGELARRLALAIGEIRSGAEEIGAASKARASLRVGVLALSPRTLLAQATGVLLARYPAQKMEVVESSYQQLARDLHDGALDVIFGALREPPPYADLIGEDLFEDPYSIVCRRDHPLTKVALVEPADLARYGWVFPTQGLPRRDVLNAMIEAWGLSPDVQIETSCLSTIIALLTASDRLSLLSRWNITLYGHSELARVESVRIPHERRNVGLTTRSGWLPTPFQDAFLTSIRTAAGPLQTFA
ncbi:MAG: hypothetical protein JWL62_281 [Hyphomicrobiales bacterium]|nr:hypothetical protein [Hyphomicrobiales bacterium]